MNSNSIATAFRAALIVALLSASSGGCYLLQSAEGQFSLMAKRRPIGRVIDAADTPASVRTQLKAVREIREFAVRELHLPDNGSYRSYADVGRRYVVWNVVAAPEFSVEPKNWCFPIVGCVAYRGYFVESRAQGYGDELRHDGWDVSVDGVAAYSTLGHFNDPILNTMMGWDDVELAAIIFHELTHQLLYVADDAAFNEALATLVEEEGVKRWLLAQGRGPELVVRESDETHYRAVVGLLTAARERLRALYATALPPAEMRLQKRAILQDLHASYEGLRTQWGGRAPFTTLFGGSINNADLASVATYYDCVPGFQRELDAQQGDLQAFFRRVKQLGKLDKKVRDSLVCGVG